MSVELLVNKVKDDVARRADAHQNGLSVGLEPAAESSASNQLPPSELTKGVYPLEFSLVIFC